MAENKEPVCILVSRDGWTGGLQLSIDDDNGGFRLAGPKFNGSSETVLRHPLTSARDIDEIEAYCKRARAAILRATQPAQPEPGKRTMTIDLTDAEMQALEKVMASKDLSAPAVFRNSFRLYQMVDHGLAHVVVHESGPLGLPDTIGKQPEPGAGELEVVAWMYGYTFDQTQQLTLFERQAKDKTGWYRPLTDLTQAQAKIARLEGEVAELRKGCAKQNDEVCQVLGKALGYPWFKDDQENFPGATEANGVCVGEHVAESLADEAARRIKDAEADAAKVREPTMFWDAEDWENGGSDPADVVGNYAPGEVVKMDTAIQGPTRWGVMNDQHEVQVFQTADEAEAWFAAQTERRA